MDGVNKLSVSDQGIVHITTDEMRMKFLKNYGNITKMVRLGRVPGHSRMIQCSDWMKDSEENLKLITGGWDNKICLWKMPANILA